MKQPKDYIIFPLDLPSVRIAKEYVKILSDSVGMFKIGLELFIHSGREIIDFIHDFSTAEIFLDLKLHDIPVTVSRAMERIADLGVKFATVHCSESNKMLQAAVAASRGKVDILGVTVLTSVSPNDIHLAGYKEKFYSNISKLVLQRAVNAKSAGCKGVVCSGLEVEMIKAKIDPDFIAVTPGIRPMWEGMKNDDQKRITTPSGAIQQGSDFLVIGRPIRDAKDPRKAAIRIAEEIEAVL
jgi:orotidine-5'-phosphate decarboxylase